MAEDEASDAEEGASDEAWAVADAEAEVSVDEVGADSDEEAPAEAEEENSDVEAEDGEGLMAFWTAALALETTDSNAALDGAETLLLDWTTAADEEIALSADERTDEEDASTDEEGDDEASVEGVDAAAGEEGDADTTSLLDEDATEDEPSEEDAGAVDVADKADESDVLTGAFDDWTTEDVVDPAAAAAASAALLLLASALASDRDESEAVSVGLKIWRAERISASERGKRRVEEMDKEGGVGKRVSVVCV